MSRLPPFRTRRIEPSLGDEVDPVTDWHADPLPVLTDVVTEVVPAPPPAPAFTPPPPAERVAAPTYAPPFEPDPPAAPVAPVVRAAPATDWQTERTPAATPMAFTMIDDEPEDTTPPVDVQALADTLVAEVMDQALPALEQAVRNAVIQALGRHGLYVDD